MKTRELKRAFYMEIDSFSCCEECNNMWLDWQCPICKARNTEHDASIILPDQVIECYKCKTKFKGVMEDLTDAVVELVE